MTTTKATSNISKFQKQSQCKIKTEWSPPYKIVKRKNTNFFYCRCGGMFWDVGNYRLHLLEHSRRELFFMAKKLNVKLQSSRISTLGIIKKLVTRAEWGEFN